MTQKPTAKLSSMPLADGGNSRVAQRRSRVLMRLIAYGHRITAKRRLPNNLGWQVRLASGQVVTIFDTGSLLVQGVNCEPVKWLLKDFDAALGAGAQHNCAPARISPGPPEPDKQSRRGPAHFDPGGSYIDPNRYPIRLLVTNELLAMSSPPPPPKVGENPKTRREMLDRLRALRYSVRSVKPLGGGEWQIELKTGQTIYYREGGRIRLGS